MKQSIRDQFEYTTILPSRLKSIALWTVTVLYAAIITATFGINPVVGVILFIGYGLLIGKFWVWVADKTATWLIINPLRTKVELDREPNILQRFYLRRFLTRNSERTFLQVNTRDRDISGFKSLFREFLPKIISFLAIMLTIARYIIVTYGVTVTDGNIGIILLQSFFLAFPILGIYLPFSLVIEDVRLMNVDPNGTVEFIGGRVRRLIDGFFGITGIISGYTIFQEQTSGVGELVFYYIAVLIVVVLLTLPVLVPTLYLYYQQHPILVNEFRREAMQLEIYPAKTSTERLTSEEIRELVLDEEPEVEDKGLMGKVRQFFTGSRTVTTTYTDDQIKELELHGAWLCPNCDYINTSIEEDSYCTQCGQQRPDHSHEPPIEKTDDHPAK